MYSFIGVQDFFHTFHTEGVLLHYKDTNSILKE